MDSELEKMEHDEQEYREEEEEEKYREEEDESMDDESSDEDDDDDDDDIKERNIIADINRLQDEISVNQYDYSKHEQLINNLRTLGELDLLRDSRERMSLLFPLEESVWLKWIEDEMSLVSSEKMTELFEMALGDFLSPKIWKLYCEFSQEIMTLEQKINFFERVVHSVGSHFLEGRYFWQLLHEVEKECFSNGSVENISTQLQRCVNHYEKQFSIPLKGMENDFDTFKNFIENIKNDSIVVDDLIKQMNKIEELFNKSVSCLKEYQEFEDRITSEPKDSQKKAAIYKEYVEFITKKNGDNLENIICLYERAIAECYNDCSLWNDYLIYCDSKLVLPNLLLPIYERSVRNVPWSSDIWIRYLYARARLQQTDSESSDGCADYNSLKSLYQKAIQNQFSTIDDYKNLTIAHLNCLRRIFTKLNYWKDSTKYNSIREEFQQPIEVFVNSYGQENSYDLKKFQATIEAKFLKSINNGKLIFEQLLPKFKHYASFWIDYATFERDYDSEEGYKNILLKGLNSCSDYPETIAELLMKYERDIGLDLNEMLVVEAKIRAFQKKWSIKRAKEEAKNKSLEEKESNMKPLKKRKNEDSKTTNDNDKQSPQNKKQKKDIIESGKHGITVQTDPLKITQTVFLSNLSFDVDEEEIKKEFSKFGEINDVRLVRNFKGNSKGYCYVEFKDPQTVHQALLHDRMMIHGRPVFISEMDKKPSFSYSLNVEKNKLFVKNIPLSYTKDDVINKIFTEYSDSIKDVRLVTYRNGFSKGWAYVELKDEETAKSAVDAKSDQEFEGRKLFVAISDPSKSAKSTNDKSLFSDKGSNPRTKFGSTNFMVPTSVRLKSVSQKPRLDTTNGPLKSNSEAANNSGGNLSNDQFRSFLTRKQ